jgi:hypothetical protein
MNNFLATSIDEQHLTEFKASEIAEDIIELNFRSWNPENENDLDEVFIQLVLEPEHRNNGTLAGPANQQLANILRSGGWIFKGYKGISVKPNSPRTNSEGKVIKYESPRGVGNQQIFITRISVRVGHLIASKIGQDTAIEYAKRTELRLPESEDTEFWEWFYSKGFALVITEGVKKAAALISAGYAAIALNGVWGWGNNVKDMFGEIEKDDRGNKLKTLHPDLETFLNGREIVMAFDRDDISSTIHKVERAKTMFVREIEGEAVCVTQIKWRGHKGIDDYIAAKGVKALDRAYANRSEIAQSKTKEERKTCGNVLLEIGKTATYFHTADKIAYADILIEGNRHTYGVRSKSFRMWLTGEYFNNEGKGIGAQSLQDTLNTLEAIAIFRGETRSVHLRTAEYQDKIYLDLGTPDWKAIEVDSVGWRLMSDPPVRFWRPDSLLPLPYPVAGGSLDELKTLINVDGSAWILIITFLLFCFCPGRVYPVLVISAHRGSGKTAAAEIIKGLIDPGKAPLIKLHSDTHKLAVAASRRWLMVYDNVSHINLDQSDDLCKLATNFGYSTRTLHTTDEETTFEFTRPQIITAIDDLVSRDDLASRVLMVQLPEITEEMRLPQAELNAKVRAASPRILGALLTALSQTLAQIPETNPNLKALPRLADYAQFSIAAEKSLGLKPGEFRLIFDRSSEQSRQVVIESSPVGEAIVSIMRDRLSWRGTASELLNELEKHTDEATYRSRYFPKAANILKRQLNRLAPDLKALSIYVKEIASSGIKIILLEKVVKVSTLSTLDSSKPLPHNKKHGVDNLKSIDTGIDTHDPSIDTSANELFGDCDDKYINIGVDTFSSVDTSIDTFEVIDTAKTTSQQNFQSISIDSVDTNSTFSKVLDEKNCLNPKGLAKQLFEVGSSCVYTGRNSQLEKQCVGVLVVREINSAGEIAALTPDGRMTTWIDPAELKLARSIDPSN